LHKFCKERRRTLRGCFECGDTTHFIADYPKRKKLDSSNKYDYTNKNDYSNKGDNKKKNCFRYKKKFQKIMPRACATLSNFNFSSEDSSSSEEHEKTKCKKGDFTGLCLMGKSSRNTSNSDVSDDLSFKSLPLKVFELENALCNQDKLLCQFLHENKNLNLKLENSFAKIASLGSMHNDMSAKPCENCKMIMVNYADLWVVHTQVASQLKSAKLELRELKAHSLLLGACTNCPTLRSDLEACSIKIKELTHKLDHSSRYSILSPPCEMCDSLKGKLQCYQREHQAKIGGCLLDFSS
jgi:hypothetical protein